MRRDVFPATSHTPSCSHHSIEKTRVSAVALAYIHVNHVLSDHVEQFSPEDFGNRTTRQFGSTSHVSLSVRLLDTTHPLPLPVCLFENTSSTSLKRGNYPRFRRSVQSSETFNNDLCKMNNRIILIVVGKLS